MERVSYSLEFILRTSPNIIYKFLTAPSCLIRWFCDKVEIDDDQYSYFWDEDDPEVAFLIDDIEEEYLRFQWEDSKINEYLEFIIKVSDVTRETVFVIRDYCDADELEYRKQLWTNQVADMKKAMGIM